MRTLGKEEQNPAPSRCSAPPLCVRGTSGAAPQQLPLVTGRQEEEAEEEEGLGLRMVSVGALVPLELTSHHPPPVPRPRAGRCAALKAEEDVGWSSPCSLGF